MKSVRTAIITGCILAGCELGADPNAGWVERMGQVDSNGTKSWELPDSAFAGIPFTISVSTWGGSCARAGRTKVVQAGMRVDLTLYDLYQTADVACEDYLGPKPHWARLQFDSPGIATIVFHGERVTDTGSGPTFTSVLDTVAIGNTVRIVAP
jgi:hypothetical protein